MDRINHVQLEKDGRIMDDEYDNHNYDTYSQEKNLMEESLIYIGRLNTRTEKYKTSHLL